MIRLLILSVIFVSAFPTFCHAQDETGGSVMDVPVAAGSVTGGDIMLSPDRSELLRLDRDAISVLVGNPDHLNVLLDTPRIAVLIPRQPGASHFTILDKDGKIIMQRQAVIAAPQRDYVRIRKSCVNANAGAECEETSLYYCPGICHNVNIIGREGAGSDALNDIPEEMPGGLSSLSLDE